MRQETYRFALDEAAAELRGIVTQFEALKARKEQIEHVLEVLRPFLDLQAEATTVEMSAAYTAPEVEEAAPEPQFTFMQVSAPGMEIVKTEPAPVEVAEQVPELVHALDEATPEQVAYFRQPTADPFQRRIDDALWGWQQRPEGLLSPI
ncbi:MAG TPA: hypothetical protein VGI45_28765 [Terracidiphilus sp.]|jgi:hypothetical protein